jgi:hypothetical protein
MATLVPLLSGCGKKYNLAVPAPRDFRSYEIGEVQEAKVGEAFVRVEAGFGFVVFEVAHAFQPPPFGYASLAPWPAGKLLLLKAVSVDDPDELFLEDPGTAGWVSVSSDGRIHRGWVSPKDVSVLSQGGWPEDVEFRESEEVVRTESSFLGVLVYSGISGDTVQMEYREFPDDRARPPSIQHLQYDLSESRTIAFRSLQIEILEAGDNSLTFRVLSDGGLPWLPRR